MGQRCSACIANLSAPTAVIAAIARIPKSGRFICLCNRNRVGRNRLLHGSPRNTTVEVWLAVSPFAEALFDISRASRPTK